MEREEAYLNQINLQKDLNSRGYNLITCGSCDNVLIHKLASRGEEEKRVVCPSCTKSNLPNDCPDLYYEGMYIGDSEKDF